ncbi:UDP-N-acetylmuramate dehydrogenase [Galbibacter pacificus]|uniref:UDP-N-acetylenolpyruvoylglucosamine reductase n=1 Tax=Galbibacter pacificus TaxID=2996052 RepID=A0ABT6FM02_9FLAO|nr:UDP-N-acetylmuramate dehydrogenase [Galbibacter pacificus]MDG3580821.1 UDP-N-acetylmuramate dehydrogenase [Galbibacter pacificus]MDG3584299.1 UDP-N-acetylmuramate dehydrogenase [Galbibacter pacificus]
MHKTDIIEHNVSLKPFNTFGIAVKAKNFIAVSSVDKLKEVLQLKTYPQKFVLGGGSNMLLTQDIEALVIKIDLKGIDIILKENDFTYVKVAAGENWHQFVQWAIGKDLGGLENLSLIPGNVGTAPIQNIGAYGVELKDIFHSCEALDANTLEPVSFTREDCRFAYRDSFFKRNKGKYIITSVTFRLTSNNHNINISYGAIGAELQKQGIKNPNIRQISNAVINIRESKLPNPKELGNSGSFFKNPVVPTSVFETLKKTYPEIPHYTVSATEVKIPAGWLIEQCGYKGKRYGDAGIHKNQALVLVNYGNASGKELWDLALKIQQSVKEKFNILIEPEVNVY